MKLGNIKVEKWQSRIFEKNSWFGNIHKKVFKLAQNQTLWYSLKNGFNIFFGFSPEVSCQKIVQIEVFGKFLDFALLVFLDFAQMISQHDV